MRNCSGTETTLEHKLLLLAAVLQLQTWPGLFFRYADTVLCAED